MQIFQSVVAAMTRF